MHTKTPESIDLVCKLHINGASQDDIARRIGISDETLRKHYSDDMHNAWCDALVKKGERFSEIGERGDAKSLLAWLTHRGGWYPARAPDNKSDKLVAVLEAVIDKL